MQFAVIQRVMGLLLVIFSTSQLPPILVSLIYNDGALKAFAVAYIITLVTGLLMWLPVYHIRREIRLRDGFVIVVLFWVLLALFGALPFAIADRPHMPFTDAFFESMSGLSTTGATSLSGLDSLPESIRYYRQQLQWLGGMGIVVLAVAVMPMLGIGGMQLYRAETPGPIKDNKLTPRITETAKALWYIYLGLTILCAIAYWLAGMSVFDAIGHSFSTIAIGGFSTHDDSIGFFKAYPAIEYIATLFMLLAGLNFALHFISWRKRSLKPYFADAEARTYFKIIGTMVLICLTVLWLAETYTGLGQTLRHGVFQAVSIATTTGFTTEGFSSWPLHLAILLITISFIGGCAGSTAGGMKVIRAMLLTRQGMREIFRLVHPDAIFHIKIGGKPMTRQVISAVWGFFVLYVFSFAVLSILMTITEQDLVTAFSAVAACLNNLGPGLGSVSENYASISPAGKWILCFAMMLGRLEFFTLLVLLTPTFWRS
jgi:trk system potassium uptake protein TrkH